MEKIMLTATKRSVIGKQVRALRRQGILPAIVFGRHIEPIAIQMDYRDTKLAIRHVTGSTLIDLNVDGEIYTTLMRDRDYDSLKDMLMHIDFQAVSMTETLRSMVSFNFIGESPAAELDATLITEMSEVEVECLPGDLPSSINVDISVLKQIGDTIHLRDLVIPPGVEILDDLDSIIMLATSSGSAEEEVEAPAAVEGGEPEVIEKGKKELEED